MPQLIAEHCYPDGARASVVAYARGEAMAPHAHTRSSVSIVLRGCLEERSHGESVRAGPLCAVVKPAGTVHANEFRVDGTLVAQLTLPASLAPCGVQGAGSAPRWDWRVGPETTPALVRMAARCLGVALTSDKTERAHADFEVIEALHSLPSRTDGACVPAWLRDACSELAQTRDGRSPGVAAIATRLGVHRHHLTRRFHRHYGVSPGEYQRRLRLARAVARLADAGESLCTVAFDAGFADQAHMTREFRRRLGVTPRQFRRLLTA